MIECTKFLEATESAALAAAAWIGKLDKYNADEAASSAMKYTLNNSNIHAHIAIGEGKKDNAPGIFSGETFGSGSGPLYDLAVDPIDGTTQTSVGGREALSIIGVSAYGKMFSTNEHYMLKAAYNINRFKHRIVNLDINTFDFTGSMPNGFTVCLLNRERNKPFISMFKKLGFKIKLIQDCDITVAILAALGGYGIDMYYGIGGATEGILAACGIKNTQYGCLETQLVDSDCNPYGTVYSEYELVEGESALIATGITDGSLLNGVSYTSSGYKTHSFIMSNDKFCKIESVKW